jgi:hypothetical protein
MKKTSALSAVFVAISIALFCWTFIVIAAVNGAFAVEPVWSSSNPSLVAVTKNGNNYNISLAFTNVAYNQTVDNFLINPHSPTTTHFTAYLNGTIAKVPNIASCKLESGDSLRVDLVFPCDNFTSGTQLYLVGLGNCFGCGGYVKLP